MKIIHIRAYIKHALLIIIVLFTHISLQAQTTDARAAQFLTSNDKMTVVYTIILTIFVVLVCFLIWLERRVRRIEKSQDK